MTAEPPLYQAHHKLDPDLKSLWTTALRSEKYTQGYTILYKSINNSFCCLGVLADISLPPSVWYDGKIHTQNYNSPSGEEISIFFPPTSILEQWNLSPQTASILSKMNDTPQSIDYKPLSFSDIADWIEEHL